MAVHVAQTVLSCAGIRAFLIEEQKIVKKVLQQKKVKKAEKKSSKKSKKKFQVNAHRGLTLLDRTLFFYVD